MEPLRSWMRKLKPAGGTKPRQGRDVEREDDGLRDGRELPLQLRHDSLHLHCRFFSLLPWLQPRKKRAVVRLVGVGDHPVPADGLEGFDRFDFPQDVLHLLQDHAGALERSAGRKLDVDSEDPLVLVRDESGREHFPQDAGTDDHTADNDDGEGRAADQQARGIHVAVGGDVKDLVETTEENAQRPAHGTRRLEEHGA